MTALLSRSLVALSTVVAGALIALAPGVASAHDTATVTIQYGQPAYQAAPRLVVQQPVVMPYAQRMHSVQAGMAEGCAAPHWDPRARYMPGQVVRQAGSLWVATDVSASVWNENSPPTLTPSYWVQAACR